LVAVAGIDEDAIAQRWGFMIGRASLDERQRRLWAASEALSHGRGGIAAVARVTGLSQSTLREGIKDLGSDEEWVTGQ
jgi:DNA-binding NtrC family response regulator